ncbi:unnamed protein product [Calypogeia fissa]
MLSSHSRVITAGYFLSLVGSNDDILETFHHIVISKKQILLILLIFITWTSLDRTDKPVMCELSQIHVGPALMARFRCSLSLLHIATDMDKVRLQPGVGGHY